MEIIGSGTRLILSLPMTRTRAIQSHFSSFLHLQTMIFEFRGKVCLEYG